MAAARRVFSDGKLASRERRLIRVESAASTVGLRHVIFRKISSSQSTEKNGEYGAVHVSPPCGDREQLDIEVRHFPSALSQQMRILNEEYLSLQEELELHQQELQSVKDHLDDLERMRTALLQRLEFLQSFIQTRKSEVQNYETESNSGYLKRFVSNSRVFKFFRNMLVREK